MLFWQDKKKKQLNIHKHSSSIQESSVKPFVELLKHIYCTYTKYGKH